MIEKIRGGKVRVIHTLFRGEIRNLEEKTSPLFFPHKKISDSPVRTTAEIEIIIGVILILY